MNPSILLLVTLPLVFNLVAGSHALLREFVPGRLRQFNDPTDYPVFNCEDGRMTVCSGCNDIKICISSSDDSINPVQKCPSTNPHCSMASGIGASCQKTVDTDKGCMEEKKNFYCTGVGYFPDPSSCQLYYDCEEPGADPNEYECPEGYKYHFQSSSCQRSTTACAPVNCTATSRSVFTVFPTDNSYYVYCQYDYSDPDKPVLAKTYVLSCGSGATFNPISEKCEFKCAKAGNFVNTAHPRQYYQCYYLGSKLTYTEKLCNPNLVFDNTRNKCIVPTVKK